MLEVRDEEYLAKVRAFADKIGLRENLEESITFLDTYAEIDGNGGRDKGASRCHLGKDFAPHSFDFLLEKRTKEGVYIRWFSGGLIFHGSHDNGGDGGAPTFSVSLTPCVGWQIHT